MILALALHIYALLLADDIKQEIERTAPQAGSALYCADWENPFPGWHFDPERDRFAMVPLPRFAPCDEVKHEGEA